MLHRSLLAVAGIAMLVAVATAGWSLNGTREASALTNCDTTEAANTAGELKMLELINGARAAAGLGALKLSPNLNRSSAWKSADSSASGTGFSHTDSLGRSPFQRAVDCGYPSGAGENIAYGYGGNDVAGAQATFNAWMQSPGHKANILLGTYKVIGIGAHGSSWTTDFGFTDDSGQAAAPPPPPPAPTATPTQPSSTGSTQPGGGSSGGSQSGGSQPGGGGQAPVNSPTAAPSPSPSPAPIERPAGLIPRFRASVADITHQ